MHLVFVCCKPLGCFLLVCFDHKPRKSIFFFKIVAFPPSESTSSMKWKVLFLSCQQRNPFPRQESPREVSHPPRPLDARRGCSRCCSWRWPSAWCAEGHGDANQNIDPDGPSDHIGFVPRWPAVPTSPPRPPPLHCSPTREFPFLPQVPMCCGVAPVGCALIRGARSKGGGGWSRVWGATLRPITPWGFWESLW